MQGTIPRSITYNMLSNLSWSFSCIRVIHCVEHYSCFEMECFVRSCGSGVTHPVCQVRVGVNTAKILNYIHVAIPSGHVQSRLP